MLTVIGRCAERLSDPLILLGRALLAWIFVHEGFDLAANFSGALAAMGKVGVPAPMGMAVIALQLCAGLVLVLGWQTRLAALALGCFCLGTATMFHNNFANHNELLHFEKDLAIAGGMFTLAARGAGSIALDTLFGRPKPAE